MRESTIAGLFDIKQRYVRSINLERDFADPSSLDGYVVTAEVRQMLSRLQVGLNSDSSQRAWRITGDYGSGKSSFALLLAYLMGGKSDLLPSKLRLALRQTNAEAHLLPVLVTGSREPIANSLLTSLAKAVQSVRTTGPAPHVLEKIERLRSSSSVRPVSVTDVIDTITAVSDYAVRSGRFNGVLIILDELGKTLEYSALHPEVEDVFLLQVLAETAARSGKKPIYVLGLLHQGFNAYAESLSQAAQREWEKVAGRFDELLFSQPIDQVSELIAEALSIKTAKLPIGIATTAAAEMERVISLGWYGASANRGSLIAVAKKLYPLHPTVIPILIRLFSRFGQNERSLFSFLLSNEPFGLQEFSSRSLRSGEWFRLNNLFDYTRAAFGHRLGVQSYRSHWNQIDSVIESFPTSEPEELELLKIVGMLNLVDSQTHSPSSEVLKSSWGWHSASPTRWKRSIEKLQRQKRILYFRGESAGFCLWPHTSVNLERAYEEASSAVGSLSKVSGLLSDYLEDRPVVARRHYIQTGNLRHFAVQYVASSRMLEELKATNLNSADGRILIVLCDTEEDRRASLEKIRTAEIAEQELTLIAIPRALNALAKTLQEAQRWKWVMTNTPELNHDRYAAAEVSRQSASAELVLKKSVLEFVGLQQGDRPTDLRWFLQGAPLRIQNGKQLLSKLSAICDERYPLAPRIKNELVNRRQLSSAAAAARMRLIERVFSHAEVVRLGFDEGKTPPEVSMYLSVLLESKLHSLSTNGWGLINPVESADLCNVLPAMHRLLAVLKLSKGRRVRVSDLLQELRQAPYGVRDGLGYLLLAVFAQMREQDLAFYENGSFLRQISGEDFLRIVKEPASFDIQFYELNAVRTSLFRRLSAVLQLPNSERERVELLDIVRPLCQFASNLPLHVQKTARLDQATVGVRTALLEAREPATLLFETLPAALSLTADEALSTRLDEFVNGLKTSLDNLRVSYPQLLERLDQYIGSNLQVKHARSDRKIIAARAQELLISMTEPRLRAFCLQLADETLGDVEWIEGLASLVCSKPPSKWLDRDIEVFERELSQMSRGFLRLESLLFVQHKQHGAETAIRVAITQRDGHEVERIVFLSTEEKTEAKALEVQIMKLLEGRQVEGEAALALAFWKTFGTKVSA